MNNLRCAAKLIGLTVLAFGIGLLASFFLPTGWLVVIEAIVIIGVAFLYFSVKWRPFFGGVPMKIITVKSPRALRALLRRLFRA